MTDWSNSLFMKLAIRHLMQEDSIYKNNYKSIEFHQLKKSPLDLHLLNHFIWLKMNKRILHLFVETEARIERVTFMQHVSVTKLIQKGSLICFKLLNQRICRSEAALWMKITNIKLALSQALWIVDRLLMTRSAICLLVVASWMFHLVNHLTPTGSGIRLLTVRLHKWIIT